MIELNQIRFSKQDKNSFLVPKLEKEIRYQEFKIKRQNDWIIKVGCIISILSLRLGFELSNSYYPMKKEQTDCFILSGVLCWLFFCLISGFFIDVICLKSTWFLVIISNIFFQFVHLVSTFVYCPSLAIIGKLSFFCLIPVSVINFSCIQYESANDFRNRLNNAIILELYGELIPLVLNLLVNALLLKEDTKIKEQHIHNVHKEIFICGIGISQLFNIISLYILYKTYNQIEIVKTKSLRYRQFLIYKGVGITVRNVFKYMRNRNIYYLLVVSALSGFLMGTLNNRNLQQTSNMQQFGAIISSMFVCLFIMKLVNQSKRLVTTCYKTTSYCLLLFLLVSLLQFVVLSIKLNSNLITDKLYLFISIGFQAVSYTLWLLIYCLIHQIVIILLPKRCAIRAISLSISFFVYFLFYLFCIQFKNHPLTLRGVQLFFGVVVSIINYFYQKSIQFNLIEEKLVKQYDLK